jgi:hypothetical protein
MLGTVTLCCSVEVNVSEELTDAIFKIEEEAKQETYSSIL